MSLAQPQTQAGVRLAALEIAAATAQPGERTETLIDRAKAYLDWALANDDE